MATPINADDLLDLAKKSPVHIVDVRRKPVFDASSSVIAGAVWRNPEEVNTWQSTLDEQREVVVYCVHGHQVSQGCADALVQAGFKARYLEGGFEHWAEEGKPVEAKP
ncbi:rhodanese family chromate resistance protein ChrE [Noviherbaspirillum sp. CPCC 100848]|uniref:Rhodanese family chromate resistance protein ChrE n=1 Tax=Noviherbaspirillum album TaxID=3080276 RepID=A0ABU6JKA8_9BURK|nr:rhodanese family chromate resistance protein ChrE [Noviherbaspirillum sp. CPCC 100848]MEC4723790.1 rhodanese family chromate resistance protein ChrE [Noviherbaspirillum sp. CPCC 100848]